MGYFWLILIGVAAILIIRKTYVPPKPPSGTKGKEILETLKSLSGLTTYSCKYVSGHPERNAGSYGCIIFGAKNGKLMFYECENIFFPSLGFTIAEGKLTPEQAEIRKNAIFVHLFDIPISGIDEIRYKFKTERDASVFIYWSDDNYRSSTEFRFAGLGYAGKDAIRRANDLVQVFEEMKYLYEQ